VNKLLSLALGLVVGAVISTALVALFAPATGEKLIGHVRRGYQDALEEARQASLTRRRELEAELKLKS
jgi:gas vesicle protein